LQNRGCLINGTSGDALALTTKAGEKLLLQLALYCTGVSFPVNEVLQVQTISGLAKRFSDTRRKDFLMELQNLTLQGPFKSAFKS